MEDTQRPSAQEAPAGSPLTSFLAGRSSSGGQHTGHTAVVVGELIGMTEEGTPLVVFPGRTGSAAVPAAAIVDVNGSWVGQRIALMFEGGDLSKPIIMGVLRPAGGPGASGQLRVEADGTNVTVTAKEQLVLRCGKASITLTRAGKVLIHGTYVVTRSSGTNRIKGAAVEIN